jgi:hypothetical protein
MAGLAPDGTGPAIGRFLIGDGSARFAVAGDGGTGSRPLEFSYDALRRQPPLVRSTRPAGAAIAAAELQCTCSPDFATFRPWPRGAGLVSHRRQPPGGQDFSLPAKKAAGRLPPARTCPGT